jgi:hypothetical protein
MNTMYKGLALLCAGALLCASTPLPSARAEQIYTGALGFTLGVPDEWVDASDEDADPYDLAPGDPEAMFVAPDERASLTVLHAEETPHAPDVVAQLLGEAYMESICAGFANYQKQLYQADPANRRAFLAYTYDEQNEPFVEYMVSFATAGDEVQTFIVTIDQDAQAELLPLVGAIVNSLDVGDPSDDAEG